MRSAVAARFLTFRILTDQQTLLVLFHLKKSTTVDLSSFS